MTSFQCGCGKRLTVEEKYAGRMVACPACRASLQVPVTAIPVAEVVTPSAPPIVAEPVDMHQRIDTQQPPVDSPSAETKPPTSPGKLYQHLDGIDDLLRYQSAGAPVLNKETATRPQRRGDGWWLGAAALTALILVGGLIWLVIAVWPDGSRTAKEPLAQRSPEPAPRTRIKIPSFPTENIPQPTIDESRAEQSMNKVLSEMRQVQDKLKSELDRGIGITDEIQRQFAEPSKIDRPPTIPSRFKSMRLPRQIPNPLGQGQFSDPKTMTETLKAQIQARAMRSIESLDRILERTGSRRLPDQTRASIERTRQRMLDSVARQFRITREQLDQIMAERQ